MSTSLTQFLLTLFSSNYLINNHTDVHHSIVMELNVVLKQTIETHYHLFNNTELPLDRIFLGMRYLVDVLHSPSSNTSDTTSSDNETNNLYTWTPMYEWLYTDVILNCAHYSHISAFKWPFLFHWIYTKYKYLGNDGFITDGNSVHLLSTIFNDIKQDSEQNINKIQSFWNEYVMPSIKLSISTRPYWIDYTPIYDSFLQSFAFDTITTNNTKNQEITFVAQFDKIISLNDYTPLQRFYYWIFRFKHIALETKERYFEMWLDDDSRTICMSSDPSNHALFDEFLFNKYLNNDQNIGMTKIHKAKDWFIKAVHNGHDLNGYYYTANTVQRLMKLTLKYKALQAYSEICDICEKFRVIELFDITGDANTYIQLLLTYQKSLDVEVVRGIH